MEIGSLTIYESWDLKPLDLPPHSRLYQLEPVGIGTPLVESLTGYIARLAEAHCVLPGVLMEKELTPIVKEFSRRSPESELKPDRAGIFSRTGTLNGIGVMAMDWVRAVETLTLRRDLRFLTMLTWTSVLPLRNLLCRHNRAYCPACYEEWRSSGQQIYEPLLWAINGVTICLHHRRRLCLQCLRCRQPFPPLAWNSRPGYCPKCKGWLGISPNTQLPDNDAVTEEEWQWQTWMIDAIGEVMAAAPRLPSPPTREGIAKAFSACIDEVSEGNLTG